MKPIFFVIAILFLLLLLLKCKSLESFDDFEEGFAGGASKSVIVCKADWCGHCKKAAPEFEKLMMASPLTLKDGSKVTVKVLDADQNKDEISKLSVKGYPSILITDGANMTEYPGPRTYDALVDFLNGA